MENSVRALSFPGPASLLSLTVRGPLCCPDPSCLVPGRSLLSSCAKALTWLTVFQYQIWRSPASTSGTQPLCPHLQILHPSSLSPSYATGRLLASSPFWKPHGLCTPYLQDLLLSSRSCPQTAALYGRQTPGSPDMLPSQSGPHFPRSPSVWLHVGPSYLCACEVYKARRACCAEGTGRPLLSPLMPRLFRTDFRWP